jgi:predicted dehydrogenase
MEKVRVGVVGTGTMGISHVAQLKEIPEVELVGVCDVNAEQVAKVGREYNCLGLTDYKELIRKDKIDAVVIATPHYFHPPVAVWAFEQGVHVLCEKPVAVTVGEAGRMIEAHRKFPHLKFGAMFQMRVNPLWKKVKSLIATGQLDKIYRISWTITDWYRTQSYYNQGGWRGTWKGEGGGVLMNQCPHQLDLLQWLFGMPNKISASCTFGRYHQIEVEDDVSATLQYADGRTMTFITSTGEYPGTNRLEICCNRGRVVVEGGKIRFDRTVELVDDFTRNSPGPWSVPEVWPVEVPAGGENLAHKGIMQNFARAILGREELIAPGEEGINSLMLANAMVYSGYTGKTVNLPLDAKEYDHLLAEFIARSKK